MSDLYELCAKTPKRVLRQKASPIEVWGPEQEELARRLSGLCGRTRGCLGLAAPQIGESVRMIAMNLPRLGVIVAVNPVIETDVELTKELVSKIRRTEGCYSLRRGREVTTERAIAVEVSFDKVCWTRRGDARIERIERALFEGGPAGVVQHEVDHLDGILITARAAPKG